MREVRQTGCSEKNDEVVARPAGAWRSSDVEILRLRMVCDDRVGALLGDEHVVFAERDADRFGLEELRDEGPVFEVGARGVAEGIAAAAVALLEDLLRVRRILRPESQLLPHPLVPEFRQRL